MNRVPQDFIRGHITETNQGIFAVGSEDMFVGASLIVNGEYGQNELAMAVSRIRSTDEVLVVGTHIGSIAIPLTKYCKHVTGIEANPWTYKLLQCNVILNDVKNISTYHFAANDKESTLKFVMNTVNSGGSKRFPKIEDPVYFNDNPKIVEVPAYPLDDKFGDKIFSLVIMDIEGSEYFALEGMKKILRNVNTLHIEFLPHHLSKVAGVTPEEFADKLLPYFSNLRFPATKESVTKENIKQVLRNKFDADEGHECIIFTK